MDLLIITYNTNEHKKRVIPGPAMDDNLTTTVTPSPRNGGAYISFKMAECSLHGEGFHNHRAITYTNLHGGTT